MKITVVGGGSTYTPETTEGLARRAPLLPVDEPWGRADALPDVLPEADRRPLPRFLASEAVDA